MKKKAFIIFALFMVLFSIVACGRKQISTTNTPLTTNSKSTTEHQHTYGDYLCDEDGHYKKCSCGFETSKEKHEYSIKRTKTKHYEECNICGYKKSEKDHDYENGICRICGAEELGTDGLIFSLENDEYVVTGYDGDSDNVVIPNFYKGKPVTKISDHAFKGSGNILNIKIPDSVTSIGYEAFYGCSSLTSITIPGSVTSIGLGAFSGCSNLKTAGPIGGGYDIEFGWKNSIPSYVFYNCSNLISVTIPNSVTSIGDSAFSGCRSLTIIIIPDSVTSIDFGAFSGCSSLTSITIPNSVTSIGSSAFFGCSGLTSILVDSNNEYYDSRNNCNAIITRKTNTLIVGCKNTVIPNSVTSIGLGAFSYCSGLTSIIIPDSVTSIGDRAFQGCSSLTSITIPGSVTSIGEYAFYNCSSLTNITILNGVRSIGEYAFYNCSNLTSIIIPDSVTSIGYEAFTYCSGLTSITIPNSVTSIGLNAFYKCSSLTDIYYTGSVTEWNSISKDSPYIPSSTTIHYNYVAE